MLTADHTNVASVQFSVKRASQVSPRKVRVVVDNHLTACGALYFYLITQVGKDQLALILGRCPALYPLSQTTQGGLIGKHKGTFDFS